MIRAVFHDSNEFPVLEPIFTGCLAVRTKIRNTCTACKSTTKTFSLKPVHSALAQSPSLLPDGFKVLPAQPIRCDFSKLDYKLCYSEILVNCSNSCIHCKLQSVSVTEKSCFQSCPYSCPSVVAINRLIRLYCRCI